MARIKKGVLANIVFPMVDGTDFASIESGITASDFNSAATRQYIGYNIGASATAAFSNLSKTTNLVTSGIFHHVLNETETDFDIIMVRFTHPSCADQLLVFETVDYTDSDIFSQLSDIGSNLLSYLVGISGMVSDVDSQLLLNASMISDIESALDSQFVYLSNAISDMNSDLSSQIGGITVSVSASDISDIASAVWADTIGARVDSRILVVQSLVSDVDSQLLLNASVLSDVQSALDSQFAYLSNAISDMNSDLSSQIGGITVTVSASDMSDIASRVWATAEGTRVDSRIVLIQSNVSDIESALDSQFVWTSNFLSDMNSDLGSKIGNVSVTLTASDISDIASAVAAAGLTISASDMSDIVSRVWSAKYNTYSAVSSSFGSFVTQQTQGLSNVASSIYELVSDVDSQLLLNASMISDIDSQLTVTHSLLSDVESQVDVISTGTPSMKYAGPNGPGIYYDDSAGNTNTTLGTDGTIANPVSSLAAATTLAVALGALRIYIINSSTLTLTGQTLTGYEFIGIGLVTTNILNLGTAASQSVLTACVIRHLYVYGQHDFSDRVELWDCAIDDAPAAEVTKLRCWARGCAFVGDFQLDTSDDNIFDMCLSGVAGNGYPVITCTGVTGTVVFRHYSGGIGLENLSASHTFSVETDGQVVFESGCNVNAAGVIRGMATITDNTAGMNNVTTIATAQYITDFISDVDSQVLLNASMISDIDSQLTVTHSLLSDVDSQLLLNASMISDIDSQLTESYSLLSDIDSQLLVTHSLVSDIESQLDVTHSLVSDIDSQLDAVWTTQLTEAYNADGTAPTAAQALFMIMQTLNEFSISGTTLTVKKLDGSTTAATFTLDDGTSPTSLTRAT